MSCTISKGRLVPCKDSVGGLDSIFIINNKNFTKPTYSVTLGSEDVIVDLASEKIINGNFSSNYGNWIVEGDVTIGGGVASWSGTDELSRIRQFNVMNTGQFYTLSYRVTSYTEGGLSAVRFGIDDDNGTTLPVTVGTHTVTGQAFQDNIQIKRSGDPTTLSITDISIKESQVDSFKYELKGNSSFEQTITASRENGTSFYDQLLSLTLSKLTKKDHKELKLLAYGRPHIIVKDYNGNYFMAGLENGLDANGGTIVTGASMGDLSGYTMTLQGNENLPANFLNITSESETELTLTADDSSTFPIKITKGV
jgi:hypothetical protein